MAGAVTPLRPTGYSRLDKARYAASPAAGSPSGTHGRAHASDVSELAATVDIDASIRSEPPQSAGRRRSSSFDAAFAAERVRVAVTRAPPTSPVVSPSAPRDGAGAARPGYGTPGAASYRRVSEPASLNLGPSAASVVGMENGQLSPPASGHLSQALGGSAPPKARAKAAAAAAEAGARGGQVAAYRVPTSAGQYGPLQASRAGDSHGAVYYAFTHSDGHAPQLPPSPGAWPPGACHCSHCMAQRELYARHNPPPSQGHYYGASLSVGGYPAADVQHTAYAHTSQGQALQQSPIARQLPASPSMRSPREQQLSPSGIGLTTLTLEVPRRRPRSFSADSAGRTRIIVTTPTSRSRGDSMGMLMTAADSVEGTGLREAADVWLVGTSGSDLQPRRFSRPDSSPDDGLDGDESSSASSSEGESSNRSSSRRRLRKRRPASWGRGGSRGTTAEGTADSTMHAKAAAPAQVPMRDDGDADSGDALASDETASFGTTQAAAAGAEDDSDYTERPTTSSRTRASKRKRTAASSRARSGSTHSATFDFPDLPPIPEGLSVVAVPAAKRKTPRKYVGVYRHHSGRWEAKIGHGRKRQYLGMYSTADVAAEAYDRAAIAIGRPPKNGFVTAVWTADAAAPMTDAASETATTAAQGGAGASTRRSTRGGSRRRATSNDSTPSGAASGRQSSW